MIGITASRERAAQVAAILDDVIELAPGERPARLDVLCGGDAALRKMVESVLGHDVPDETPFRAAIGAALDVAAASVAIDQQGRRLGPYRIVQEIGRGGMGAVYLAVRDDREFDQQVAVKVVRGLLAPDSVRRFRAERQILATLAHPNIGRLLDGGTTPDGTPYFVMEHIDGRPIDVFCREQHLSVRDMLRLFATVCDAVAYAHSRLVVHRDLKPTNILVTAGGEPKLLDFGIAALVDPDDGDAGVAAPPLTGAMAHLLTPEYASPEQIRGERVTTASDVYSLGVVLYELLTGTRPYRFPSRRPDEMARIVCETVPERPSSAGGRHLAGDLDTIVLAALEKEPSRRFPSVEALAQDIRRHLAGEPIQIRPTTWLYRSRRFVRRHRIGVAAAASIVMLLAGWAVTLSIQARRIAQQRDTAQQVTAFLVDLFASSDPFETRSAAVTARELVDKGAATLPQLADRPAIHAQLLDTVGKVYRSLGESNRSAELLREAVDLRERIDGAGAPATAATMNELAEALRESGKFDDAEPLYRRALEIRERAFGTRSTETAHSRNNLALLLRARGKNDEAAALFADAVSIWKATLGPRHPQVAVGLSNQSLIARDAGRLEESERLVREALEIRLAALGEQHPQTANSLMALGQTLNLQGRNREAEAPMARALELRRKIYGNDAATVDASLNNLASLRQDLGDLAGAEPLYREALANQRRRLGPRHPEVAITANNLASLLEEQRQYPEAEALFRESLDIRRERYGARHAAVARAMHNLARLLIAAQHAAEGAPLAHDAWSMRRDLLGDQHADTAASLVLIAKTRAARGDRAGAERLMRDALAVQQSTLPPGHPAITATEYELGLLLLSDGRRHEAEPLLRRAAETRSAKLPSGHWLRLETDAAWQRAQANPSPR